jgi:hypothetical protein
MSTHLKRAALPGRYLADGVPVGLVGTTHGTGRTTMMGDTK